MKLLIACLFLLPGEVLASPDAIRSEAYIIYSDTQTVLPNGNIKAFGAMQIISGDMKIEADEAIFHRENPDNLFVTATGTPIRYKGILENGCPFSGHSLELKYVIESGEIILTNEAFIRLQDSTLSASVITYNVQSKTMTATGSNDTRVFETAGRDYRIEPDLLRVISFRESSWRDNALNIVSHNEYAVGKMQRPCT